MRDTIYRDEAVEAVEELNAISFYELNEHSKEAFTEIRRALKALPSADRPQEWIETPDGTMCGNCHKFPYDDGEYHIANWSSDFCPHCGVRMKGAYNGEDIQSTDE